MGKPQVLLVGEIDHAHDTWTALDDIAERLTLSASTRDRASFLAECRSGRWDGVVAVYRTLASVAITGRWDGELVGALPASVRFCAHVGAGYDQIDVAACSARAPVPLRVANTPTAVDDATADTAVFLILGALRGFNAGMQALREGKWRGDPPPPLGHDPEGKTLGILGMGGVGRNMKRKTDALGMKTIYHNRNRLSEEEADGARYVTFEELLAQSDVLSLNLPLNQSTHHIISTGQFAQMKPGVVLVNTARGGVVDEGALVAALASGRVASCGLDVYEEEPDVHPGLVANPRVLLLPHLGTWTRETQRAMERAALANVRAALTTGTLRDAVPEQRDL